MAIKKTDFPALTNYLNELFNDAAAHAVEKMVGPKVFQVKDTPFFTHDYQALHGATGIQKVAEGADLVSVNNVEGRLSSFFQTLTCSIA